MHLQNRCGAAGHLKPRERSASPDEGHTCQGGRWPSRYPRAPGHLVSVTSPVCHGASENGRPSPETLKSALARAGQDRASHMEPDRLGHMWEEGGEHGGEWIWGKCT